MDGQEYLKAFTVTFQGKEYQEFKGIEYNRPHTEYAEILDGDFVLVENRDLYLSLRIICAIDIRSIFGTLILDDPFMLNEKEFEIKNGELYIFNERKRAKFNNTVHRTKAK